MKKKVIRLDISYDGSGFFGYQIQPTVRTVQGELEKALEKLFKEKIGVVAAGRTDTGVHAMHQVVSFKTSGPIPLEGIHKGLNSILPKDIRVLKVIEEHPRFHARFEPKRRNYLYVILNSENCPPFLSSYVWCIKEKIPLRKLKQCLRNLEGTHDFSSFSERTEKKNHIRTLYSVKVKKKGKFIYVYLRGDAFLRRMIRVIMGTTVSIALRENESPKMVREILEKKNRSENPFITAPPTGLYFYKVEF
jgi:tRNA pseudouridine38-40 synthase